MDVDGDEYTYNVETVRNEELVQPPLTASNSEASQPKLDEDVDSMPRDTDMEGTVDDSTTAQETSPPPQDDVEMGQTLEASTAPATEEPPSTHLNTSTFNSAELMNLWYNFQPPPVESPKPRVLPVIAPTVIQPKPITHLVGYKFNISGMSQSVNPNQKDDNNSSEQTSPPCEHHDAPVEDLLQGVQSSKPHVKDPLDKFHGNEGIKNDGGVKDDGGVKSDDGTGVSVESSSLELKAESVDPTQEDEKTLQEATSPPLYNPDVPLVGLHKHRSASKPQLEALPERVHGAQISTDSDASQPIDALTKELQTVRSELASEKEMHKEYEQCTQNEMNELRAQITHLQAQLDAKQPPVPKEPLVAKTPVTKRIVLMPETKPEFSWRNVTLNFRDSGNAFRTRSAKLRAPWRDYLVLPRTIQVELARHGLSPLLTEQLALKLQLVVEYLEWQKWETHVEKEVESTYDPTRDIEKAVYTECQELIKGQEWKNIEVYEGPKGLYSKLKIVMHIAQARHDLDAMTTPDKLRHLAGMTRLKTRAHLGRLYNCLEGFMEASTGFRAQQFDFAPVFSGSAFKKRKFLHECLKPYYDGCGKCPPWMPLSAPWYDDSESENDNDSVSETYSYLQNSRTAKAKKSPVSQPKVQDVATQTRHSSESPSVGQNVSVTQNRQSSDSSPIVQAAPIQQVAQPLVSPIVQESSIPKMRKSSELTPVLPDSPIRIPTGGFEDFLDIPNMFGDLTEPTPSEYCWFGDEENVYDSPPAAVATPPTAHAPEPVVFTQPTTTPLAPTPATTSSAPTQLPVTVTRTFSPSSLVLIGAAACYAALKFMF
jgi:hypothetical protein